MRGGGAEIIGIGMGEGMCIAGGEAVTVGRVIDFGMSGGGEDITVGGVNCCATAISTASEVLCTC